MPFNPTFTPKWIKFTILATCVVSLLSAVFQLYFKTQLGPQLLLSLTSIGIQNHLYFQLFTNLFLQPLNGFISFSYAITLFFNMYLLWTFGSSIIQNKNLKSFIILYFGGGVFASLIALVFMKFSSSLLIYSGVSSSLFSLLIGWLILFPNMPITLFMAMTFKSKWLILIFYGIHLFQHIGSPVYFLASLGAGAFGYLAGVITWELLGPFEVLHPFERRLIRLKRRKKTHSKIVDISDFS